MFCKVPSGDVGLIEFSHYHDLLLYDNWFPARDTYFALLRPGVHLKFGSIKIHSLDSTVRNSFVTTFKISSNSIKLRILTTVAFSVADGLEATVLRIYDARPDTMRQISQQLMTPGMDIVSREIADWIELHPEEALPETTTNDKMFRPAFLRYLKYTQLRNGLSREMLSIHSTSITIIPELEQDPKQLSYDDEVQAIFSNMTLLERAGRMTFCTAASAVVIWTGTHYALPYLGFGKLGPIAKSFAATFQGWMAKFGIIKYAGSGWYATMQRTAMHSGCTCAANTMAASKLALFCGFSKEEVGAIYKRSTDAALDYAKNYALTSEGYDKLTIATQATKKLIDSVKDGTGELLDKTVGRLPEITEQVKESHLAKQTTKLANDALIQTKKLASKAADTTKKLASTFGAWLNF